MGKWNYFNSPKHYGLQAPCKDCEERHPLCHSTCQRYIDFTTELKRRREADYDYRKTADDYYKTRYGKYPKKKGQI